MDHIQAEERLVNERLRRKLNEVNAAAQSHLSGVQDHINFTLQVFPPQNPRSSYILASISFFYFFFGFQCVYVVFQFCSWFGRQEAYFKCAYECFGGRKDYGVVNNCVEHCSVPVISAQNLVENEMAKFQVAFYSLCELPFNELKFRAWLLLKVESYFRAAFLTKLVKYKLPTSQ